MLRSLVAEAAGYSTKPLGAAPRKPPFPSEAIAALSVSSEDEGTEVEDEPDPAATPPFPQVTPVRLATALKACVPAPATPGGLEGSESPLRRLGRLKAKVLSSASPSPTRQRAPLGEGLWIATEQDLGTTWVRRGRFPRILLSQVAVPTNTEGGGLGHTARQGQGVTRGPWGGIARGIWRDLPRRLSRPLRRVPRSVSAPT